jgi:nicotinamide riboside kinase
MKKRFIAFTGVQCSGKSTLFNKLKEDSRLKDWQFINSHGRELAKWLGLNELKTADWNFQAYITQLTVGDYYSASNNAISERCIVDAASYADWLRDHGELDYAASAFCETAWRLIIPLTEIVFYCPPVPMVEDGFRDTDEQYRNEMEELFKKRVISASFDTRVVHLEGSIETRMAIINDVLKEIL